MIEVNLVGNPNTGKTTLFNSLTSSHEHVGNWHGVTVEEKAKIYKYQNEEIKLVDLPGIYSLTSLSYEEDVACKYILKNKDKIIVNICDAGNLQRNLYLTLGLMELGCPIILAVNQIDKRANCTIDFVKLENLLNIKVVYLNADDKKSVNKLNEEILKISQNLQKKHYFLPYFNDLELKNLNKFILFEDKEIENFLKIKLLEDDDKVKKALKINESFNQSDVVSSARYKYIDEVLSKCCSKKQKVYGKSKLDKIFLNRFLAFPIFLSFIALAFYLTFFSLGKWLSNGLNFLLENFIGNPILTFLMNTFGEGWITGLFREAIIGGVGSILSFLPQVALLFFFLSLLEDSGYLSRVAFVFDDILSKVGLSGKSVYTLLMGFGCSTTAVLTARNMEDKNSKIKTGLLTPYMSCSAKFPIYSVLGGAFFGASNIWVILGLYILGVVVAIFMSFIFEKTVLKSKSQSFILEFPPYRMMSFKRTFSLLWQNVKLFIIRVGSLIVAMNVIVWVLSSFSFTFKYVAINGGVSMLETLGRIFAPIFIPLGFGSWGLVSALIAGLVAKEVIVSSIAMFNGLSDSSMGSLQESITNPSSAIFFAGGASVISYLAFCLLYFPCLATVSVLSKEIGRKWTAIGIVLQFVVAYVVALIAYNISKLCYIFGLMKVVLILISIIIVVSSIIVVYRRVKGKKLCPYSKKCGKNCKKQ